MSIHFVIPSVYADEVAALPDRTLGKDYPYWLAGRFIWVAHSWLVLREYREGMTLGTAPIPGRVNFSHVMGWRDIGARSGEYRVSARADYPRMFDVDFEILQNPAVKMGTRQAYLPHWPVPGIIPRDRSRMGVHTFAYAGRIGPLNLAEELKNRTDCILPDLEFRIIPPERWHDLSQVDALVAIRSLDTARHESKPPSKLFLAWLADIPLIAGYDSAFSTVGAPGVEYIRVSSADELRSALKRLRDDPEFYQSFVEKGRVRAKEISQDALARIWLELFDTRIAADFEAWKDLRMKGLHFLAARGADRSRNVASHIRRQLRNLGGS